MQEISHVRHLQAWDLGFIELPVLDSICGSQNLGFGAVFGLGPYYQDSLQPLCFCAQGCEFSSSVSVFIQITVPALGTWNALPCSAHGVRDACRVLH